MNITGQDCINGRKAVRRDGEIVKLTEWAGTEEYPVWASDGRMRRGDGLFISWEKNQADLLCWREDLVHEVRRFTVENAQKALDGNYSGLLDGFEWAVSPQRVGYWEDVYDALGRGEPLPDEARDILLASIAVAKREAEVKPAETPEPAETPLVQIVVSVPLDRVAEMYEIAAGLCEEGEK